MTDAPLHQIRMQKLQAAMQARMARATEKRGLLLVHTGNGKGKSTAALGMLVRSLGHGFKCAVVQFIKGSQPTAETALVQAFPGLLSWDRCGDGFTWDTQDREGDVARVREGWEIVKAHLADPDLRFLMLDEFNVVLQHRYFPVEELLEALAARPDHLHVVLTGRGAPQVLIDAADLVTEMRMVKHPFAAGVQAQPGLEF
ncbi:cob(I)yrinic acid a,c-diamide adenosyltransferase [Geothrix limicola]|uniref:corrinoid adenosyltransferase n=1 Tax=Geothrix limicola TaxID=2927978 RepID=A0ABQ5QFP5_9BACT|nr:cob(I)yrinic acid a,c-diamide adenosyltransferase [Geothrix limicola]GLH73472.1 cob(I)yrinic acid a,c-diamide adenosyltransferase [Geothrix limicola]